MTNCYLSIIIPAYNEEKKIEKDLALVYDYLEKQPYTYEVLVVDDGSRDKTSEIVMSLKAGYRNLSCIKYKENRGKGYAVRTGMLQAKGEYVLFADAGTCVPFEDLEKAIRLLRDSCDVAIGSRALPESQVLRKQPKYRQIGSRLFGVVVRHIMGVNPIKDTQCGFKAFKREAALAIFNRNRINGFMFDTETILNAKKMSFKIIEFPVTWRSDPDTRFNPIFGTFRNMMELLQIKLSIRRRSNGEGDKSRRKDSTSHTRGSSF